MQADAAWLWAMGSEDTTCGHSAWHSNGSSAVLVTTTRQMCYPSPDFSSVEREMQEDAVRLWAMANKDAMFDEYAAVCVEEWKARHRDTKPLQIYLAGVAKPRLTPSI